MHLSSKEPRDAKGTKQLCLGLGECIWTWNVQYTKNDYIYTLYSETLTLVLILKQLKNAMGWIRTRVPSHSSNDWAIEHDIHFL